MFCDLRHLPAVIFTVMVVREQVQFSLEFLQVFHAAVLPGMQQEFLQSPIQAYRLNRPTSLLQAFRRIFEVG